MYRRYRGRLVRCGAATLPSRAGGPSSRARRIPVFRPTQAGRAAASHRASGATAPRFLPTMKSVLRFEERGSPETSPVTWASCRPCAGASRLRHKMPSSQRAKRPRYERSFRHYGNSSQFTAGRKWAANFWGNLQTVECETSTLAPKRARAEILNCALRKGRNPRRRTWSGIWSFYISCSAPPRRQGAAPPHLRRGAFRNSPPESGGEARSRRGGFMDASHGVRKSRNSRRRT